MGAGDKQDPHRCKKRSLLGYKLTGYLGDLGLLASRHRSVYPLPGNRNFLLNHLVKPMIEISAHVPAYAHCTLCAGFPLGGILGDAVETSLFGLQRLSRTIHKALTIDPDNCFKHNRFNHSKSVNLKRTTKTLVNRRRLHYRGESAGEVARPSTAIKRRPPHNFNNLKSGRKHNMALSIVINCHSDPTIYSSQFARVSISNRTVPKHILHGNRV